MPGLLALAIFMASLVIVVQNVAMERPSEAGVNERAVVERYQAFVFHAAQYMQANPGATGVIYWNTIKTAGPAGIQAAEMPPDWRIVADGGSYVTCTTFPDKFTAGRIDLLLLAREEKINPVGDKLVVGQPGNTASLISEGAKCD